MKRSLAKTAYSLVALVFPIACFLSMAGPIGCSATTGTDESTTQVPAAPANTGETVSERGKKWGGWRWEGDRDKCYFVFRNECFATKKAACKAADCEDRPCRTVVGAPSKVSCQE